MIFSIRYLIYRRLHSNEFSKICQSVIEKFAATLNLSIWSKISSSIPNDPNKVGDFIQNCNADSSERLSDGLMVKIFTICIITVSDLFQKSEFTSVRLSKNYICFTLNVMILKTLRDKSRVGMINARTQPCQLLPRIMNFFSYLKFLVAVNL